MAYKVIARKFRPQTFEDVVGQKHVTRTLQNAIKDNRIAHAFLFAGERGVGKTSVARILAKALNCHSGPAETPCGKCVSCTEITEGNSPDVNEIDGASNNSVEDIRTLRENIKYLPSRDRYRIYIIDEVHMLSNSAFNALLKTLEEPPEHVLFVFATTEPHKIPDTIISRCLRFDFKRISAKEIAEHLEIIASNEKVDISQRGLFLIARESEGSMRDAQTIFERAISYCGGKVSDSDMEELLGHIDRKHIYRILGAVLSGDTVECIVGLNEIYDLGIDMKQFYYSFLGYLRDLMVAKSIGDCSKLVELTDEDLTKLIEMSKDVTADEVHRCFRLWFSSEGEIVRCAFPKTALEVCLVEMIHLKQSIHVDEIITKIDTLKQMFSHSSGTKLSPPYSVSQESGNRKQVVAEKKETWEPVSTMVTNEGTAGFLEYVCTKHPPIASKLKLGNIKMAKNDILQIEFPAGHIFIDQLKDTGNEKKLQEFCSDFFKRPVKLSIVSSSEKNYNVRDDEILKRKEIMENPVIDKLLKTFSGTII